MGVITARYNGWCRKCGQAITAGTKINWSNSTATHVDCPTKVQPTANATATPAVEGPIVWSDESQYKPSTEGYVGKTLFAPSRTKEYAGKVVTIVGMKSRYIREDGMSFGLSDDSGYLVAVYARLATAEEEARFLEAEAVKKAEQDRRDAEQRAKAEAERAQAEEVKALRTTLTTGLVDGGGTGFTWKVMDGDFTQMGKLRDGYWDVTLVTGKLKNGAPIVRETSYGSDDDRLHFWSTTEGGDPHVRGLRGGDGREADRLHPGRGPQVAHPVRRLRGDRVLSVARSQGRWSRPHEGASLVIGRRSSRPMSRGPRSFEQRFPFSWTILVAKRPPRDEYVGRTLRMPFGSSHHGKVVVVKFQSSSYCPEGGLARGFSLDQGWVVELRARSATPAEIAAFVAREGR